VAFHGLKKPRKPVAKNEMLKTKGLPRFLRQAGQAMVGFLRSLNNTDRQSSMKSVTRAQLIFSCLVGVLVYFALERYADHDSGIMRAADQRAWLGSVFKPEGTV
jgi:hypothetical protein